jgi:hypothetical protein
MKDIFSQALLDKIASAKDAKVGKHKEKIKEKLVELQDFISTLDQNKQNISDEDSYKKYVKFLKDAINSTIEQITAPTVDDFIAWIDQIVGDSKKTEQFRAYLISNFSDAISARIDSILANKDSLESENSMFLPLLSAVNKELKKSCNDFLNKPEEYQNSIDDFLQKLDDTLSGLSEIEELSYCTIDELFSEEQKNKKIDFYAGVIAKIVEENQSLKPINESEKDDSILDKVNARISDINKCIEVLENTDIANNQDENIKKLFLKFDDKMVDAKNGVYNFLDNFIDNTWNEVETNYFKIKEYFENVVTLSANPTDWDFFPKKSKINSLIEDYNLILAENPQQTILTLSINDIAKALEKKVKSIGKYEKSEGEVKQEITEVFENLTAEYENKIPLLDSLLSTNSTLATLTQDIKDSIEGLKNGCNSLKDKDIVTYLNEDFSIDLNTYNNIRTWFNEVLQKSGMTSHLTWLDARLENAESGEISEKDFDADVLKELLSKGLITLTIEKTF